MISTAYTFSPADHFLRPAAEDVQAVAVEVQVTEAVDTAVVSHLSPSSMGWGPNRHSHPVEGDFDAGGALLAMMVMRFLEVLG